jgi:hypothetical protein
MPARWAAAQRRMPKPYLGPSSPCLSWRPAHSASLHCADTAGQILQPARCSHVRRPQGIGRSPGGAEPHGARGTRQVAAAGAWFARVACQAGRTAVSCRFMPRCALVALYF